jgi:integrase
MAGEGMVGLAQERVFGSVGLGKLASDGANPLCPSCSPKVTKVYRDGLRIKADGSSVQRWLCRDCGLRFSEKPLQEISERSLNSSGALASKRQICALGAKNLTATEVKTVAGDKPKQRKPANFGNPKNIEKLTGMPRRLMEDFTDYLVREGYVEENQYGPLLAHLVLDGADLLNPESIKAAIATQTKKNGKRWSNSYKMIATCAYDAFCDMQGITWKRPTYVQDEADVYLAAREELDLMVSAARKKMSTFLKTLDETLADPEEIIRCDWLDLHGNILSIGHPVKGHLTGKYELTPQLVQMINALPRKNERIFASNYNVLYESFHNLRKTCAERFNNPLLLKITFKSYRHFGATMLARITNGNVPEMARILRHKNWKNTQKYVHLAKLPLRNDDFDTTIAVTPEEILAMGKGNWQKYDESVFGGIVYHYYRRPKRFSTAAAKPYTISPEPVTKGS